MGQWDVRGSYLLASYWPIGLLAYRPMYTRRMKTTRRAFVGASAAAAAHVWVPKPVKGYTAAELMKPVTPMKAGVSKSELDTPALCVDLDKLERNIAKMQ